MNFGMYIVVHYHITSYNYHCPHTHEPNNINNCKWCFTSKPKYIFTYKQQNLKVKTHKEDSHKCINKLFVVLTNSHVLKFEIIKNTLKFDLRTHNLGLHPKYETFGI